MYAEISAAIESAKTALTIAKAAHNLSSFNELVSAISEVNTKLMDATTVALASQEKQSALTNRITELENQLRQVKDWESQIERYKLYEFTETGAFAYKLQEAMSNGEPLHYLCTTCVNDRKKSIMQPNGIALICPMCKTSILAQKTPPITNTSRRTLY